MDEEPVLPPETLAAVIDPDKRRAWAQRDPSLNAKTPARADSLTLPARTRPISALVKLRGDMSSPMQRVAGKMQELVADHGVFRAVYWNFHEIAPNVYRSAQPSARRLEQAAGLGIRTVVNLRGERDCATYLEETAACRRLGLDLVDFPMRSRLAPLPERLRALCELFETAPRPLLMHCKTGADRTGFASAIYLLDIVRAPAEVARRQLHMRYGHFRSTRAGILDAIVDHYAAAHERTGISFRTWLADGYDPDAIMREFGSPRLSRLLTNRFFDLE